MAAALYEQALVVDMATRSTANAGDFTGTTTQALSTGTAAPGKYIDRINVAIRGTSVQGSVRFFIKTGGVAYFQFEVPVPARTVTPGANVAFSVEVPCYIPLPSASYTLEFNTETNDPVLITAKGKSYV